MESFEDLGLSETLVEALTAEGLERPSAFQQAAIPVIRRGHNLIGAAGPGSGCRAAYCVALLDRLEAESGPTRAVIVTPTAETARRGAELMARMALGTGHDVAALGSPWVLAERATILFGTPRDVLAAVEASRVKLEELRTLVVDGASTITELGELAALESLLEVVPAEAQRIVLSLPVTKAVEDLVERHVRKAVHLPPRPVADRGRAPSAARGRLRYAVCAEERADTLLAVVEETLRSEARHAVVFFSSDDRAADLGDLLTLHGFVAGEPGQDAFPVWLAVDELRTRRLLEGFESLDQVTVVSYDVPPDPDTLDRRHGIGSEGIVLVTPEEVAHLRATAAEAGYGLSPLPRPLDAPRIVSGLERLRARVAGALARDLGGELLVLQPLFATHAPAEVAAALLSLLKESGEDQEGALPERPVSAEHPAPAVGSTWTRLFISVGSKDAVGPGDLVGAISGEAGIAGSQVGKIEIRETFSLVDVQQGVAERVIRALNGITLRGRSVRADYDRGSRGAARTGAARGKPRGAKSEGPRRRDSRPGSRRRDRPSEP